MRYHEPDIIVQENVKQFDTSFFIDIFTEVSDTILKSPSARPSAGEERPYVATTQIVKPNHISFPTEGERKYMIAILNGPTRVGREFVGVPLLEVLGSLRLKNDASIYLSAPSELLDGYFHERVEAQHLLGCNLSNSTWFNTLTPAERGRLLEHKQNVVAKGLCDVDEGGTYIWKVPVALVMLESIVGFSQQIATKCAPRLKTNAKLYDLVSDRLVCPEELWTLQGWPSPGLVPEHLARTNPHSNLALLPEARHRVLMGNGMHLGGATAVMFYMLGTVHIE